MGKQEGKTTTLGCALHSLRRDCAFSQEGHLYPLHSRTFQTVTQNTLPLGFGLDSLVVRHCVLLRKKIQNFGDSDELRENHAMENQAGG